MYPKSLENLIQCFKNLPGVGAKTAERYAFSVLEASEEEVELFLKSMKDVKEKVHTCSRCGNICEEDLCSICKDPSRDETMICVVQEPNDVLAMEKMKENNLTYHVLNGVLSSSKGIMPEDLNIESLMKRVDENTKEVILATNPTMEGETTALYLDKLLKSKEVNVTRIAHGLPMGGHLDYADELTLIKAFEGRKKI